VRSSEAPVREDVLVACAPAGRRSPWPKVAEWELGTGVSWGFPIFLIYVGFTRLYWALYCLFGFSMPGTKIPSVIPVFKIKEPNLLTVNLVSIPIISVRFFILVYFAQAY
jgi:hypothetical protein